MRTCSLLTSSLVPEMGGGGGINQAYDKLANWQAYP